MAPSFKMNRLYGAGMAPSLSFDFSFAFGFGFPVCEGCREGGFEPRPSFVSGAGAPPAWDPTLDGAGECSELILLPSLVENIRVSRFVMDGFSGCGLASVDGGAALLLPLLLPLLFTFSVLGELLPLREVGLDSGDPTRDGVCDKAGEGIGFWALDVRLALFTLPAGDMVAERDVLR